MAAPSHFVIRPGDYLATLVFGALALAFIGHEWVGSPWTARAEATVIGPVYPLARGAGALTPITHLGGGRTVEADLRTWFYRPKVGSTVSIRYDPNNPQDVAPDDFWQLHYASVAALGIVLLAAWIETARLNDRWRLRHSELAG